MSDFFKIKRENDKDYVWDPLRKKYLLLTPEEEVRQLILAFMVEQCQYPAALISVEKQIKVNGLTRRYDIVVYNKKGLPCLLVECKKKEQIISQKTIDQAAIYNIRLKVPYLMVSNGKQHFIVQIDQNAGIYTWLKNLPPFSELEGLQ
jgi:type I site-specific restriction endonuclease